ncbi:MAG: MFS transporter [Myxococcales bacterium]|nr:MFS transporter [Myxococcales bacterium]
MVRPAGRSQVAVIAALLVAYAAFYLCRANVDAAIPFLLRDGYGDKTRLGILATVATGAYALGKMVLGTAGDVVGGRRLMLGAIAGSFACSLAFGASHAFAALLLLAAANRFFQAGGWPGLVQIVSLRFESARHGLVMGVLSTSYELGNVCALTLSGLVAGALGWRALFVVNPLLFLAIGGAAVLSLPRLAMPFRAPAGDAPRAASTVAAAPLPEKNDPYREANLDAPAASVLAALLRSGGFWTALVLSALLTFIRVGFLTWTPTFLSDLAHATGNAEISTAIVKSAVFPAAGVVGALTFGPLSDRLGAGRRAPVMAASLALLVILVEGLSRGVLREPTPLIAAIGFFLLGPYSLLAGAIALDVGGPRGSATAAGFIDGAGYIVATAAPVLLGHLAERGGWSAAFHLVAGATLVAALVSGAWSIVVARRAPRTTELPA